MYSFVKYKQFVCDFDIYIFSNFFPQFLEKSLIQHIILYLLRDA